MGRPTRSGGPCRFCVSDAIVSPMPPRPRRAAKQEPAPTTRGAPRAKPASGARRAPRGTTAGAAPGTPSAVKLTSLDKVLFPDPGITKGDVLDYYRSIAPTLLPHLKDRP